jgi:hypothetical protein
LLSAILAAPALAETQAVSANAIKAVLFYKLPQFVYLPDEDKSRALVICALGNHPIDSLLEKLARTPVNGRTAEFQRIDSAAEAKECDFVFITRDAAADIDIILRRLNARGVVTVSDIPDFARSGGMVELSENQAKAGIQIVINRKAAQSKGIDFNAQLLRLAKIVE